MGGGGDSDDSSALFSAPTWAITLTCACFIVVSQAIERIIHRIGRALADKHNLAALRHAFERMKDELLMVGILSLLLAMGEDLFGHVCVPTKSYTIGRLCKHPFENNETSNVIHAQETQLLSSSRCRKDHVPLMSTRSIHDLHKLIFILAVVHIAFSIMIIAIGMWLVGRWKVWEDDVAFQEQNEDQSTKGGVRITRLITFIQGRAPSERWTNPLVVYMVAFFKQFHPNVSKADYTTLRRGFIKYHCATNLRFNFHKFIQRSFQQDFMLVVGISWKLWGYCIIWLLININGWEMRWLVFCIPLVLTLVIGTKMQQIIIKMAMEIRRQHSVVIDLPHVEPNDEYFWFGKPHFILHCFHFIVFQNALATTYAIWAAVTFPPHNCLYKGSTSLFIRLGIGVGMQVIFGFLILPVYALISQMGSHLENAVIEEYVDHGRSIRRANVNNENSMRSQQHHGIETEPPLIEDSGESPLIHHAVQMAQM